MMKRRGRGKHASAAVTERLHLTDRRIGALEKPEKTRSVYDATSRLGLKLTPTGKRVFFWFRSVRGTPVWRGIGEWPTISLAVARDKADEYDGDLAKWKKEGYKGTNPFTLPDNAGALTLEKLAELYIDTRGPDWKNPEKTAKGVRDTLDWYLSDWKQLELGDITRPMVLARYAKLRKEIGGPTANRTVDAVRTLYKWAIDCEIWAGANPARMNKKDRYKEVERKRFLEPEELVRLMAACKQLREKKGKRNPDLADFVLLCLATGQRKKTVMHSKWDAIDFKKQTWFLTAAETKNREEFTVELSKEALRVLRERFEHRHHGSPWVFPGIDPMEPRFDFNQGAWKGLLKSAELDYPRKDKRNVRIHDLRHTFVSYGIMSGRSLEQMAAAVGHASPRSTQRYAHLMSTVTRESVLAGEAEMQKRIKMAQTKQLPG